MVPYVARLEEFSFEDGGLLDQHNVTLYMFLRDRHYDLLYHANDWKKVGLDSLFKRDQELNECIEEIDAYLKRLEKANLVR